MMRTSMRNISARSIPVCAAALATHAVLGSTGLTPVSTFSKPNAPLIARVECDSGHTVELVALDKNAKELGRASVSAGEVDLITLLPVLSAQAHASRVQLLVDGTPLAAPLLVVPLLGRPTIRLTTALRADGKTSYTRVIGWGDRLLDESNVEYQKLKAAWIPADAAPLSGLRLSLDEDVIFTTTTGEIVIRMRADEAPQTARNFVDLARNGFYDGTPFHRVVPLDREGRPFVIQGGDPIGTGDGGPGYDIMLEPSALAHDFGVLSIARNDWPDSGGSQFFFCLSREGTARLDGQYCAFGEAVTGADVITRIADVDIADLATGRPKTLHHVTTAKVVPALPWTPGIGRGDARVTQSLPNTTATDALKVGDR